MKRTFMLALGFGLTAGSVWSQTNALEFDPGTSVAAANGGQTVGWQFDVNAPIAVTHLQWYDEGQDGLNRSHRVGIWDPFGTLLVSGIVPAGDAAPLSGIWRTLDVTDVVLDLGVGYTIGGFDGLEAGDAFVFNAAYTTQPDITWAGARFSPLNGQFQRPTMASSATSGFFGPSFQISAAPVPEPATLAALAAGLGFLARRRRKA